MICVKGEETTPEWKVALAGAALGLVLVAPSAGLAQDADLRSARGVVALLSGPAWAGRVMDHGPTSSVSENLEGGGFSVLAYLFSGCDGQGRGCSDAKIEIAYSQTSITPERLSAWNKQSPGCALEVDPLYGDTLLRRTLKLSGATAAGIKREYQSMVACDQQVRAYMTR